MTPTTQPQTGAECCNRPQSTPFCAYCGGRLRGPLSVRIIKTVVVDSMLNDRIGCTWWPDAVWFFRRTCRAFWRLIYAGRK